MPGENPCFGCAGRIIGNNKRVPAPCCWGHDELVMSVGVYNRNFRDEETSRFVGYRDDMWMGEMVVVSHVDESGNLKPCSKLDLGTGLCTIYEDRPLACKDLKPEVHHLCIKTGRQR